MRTMTNIRLWVGALTVLACVTVASIVLSSNAAAQEVTPRKGVDKIETSAAKPGSLSPQDAKLIELRDEVRALRQDVQRLLRLLESQATEGKQAGPKDSGETKRSTTTNHEKSTSRLYQKVYAAADLLLLGERAVKADADDRSAAPPPVPAAAQADFDSLEELIMANVAPNSWERTGGDATIQRFPNNLSLVISQTETNHKRIAELFEKLRRGHDRITLETRIITLADAARLDLTLSPHKPQILSAQELKSLLENAQSDRRASLVASPVLSVPSGQVANIRLPLADSGEMDLLIHADVEDDSHAIRLGLVVNAKDAVEALRSNASIMVRRGQTVILDVTERLTLVDGEQDTSLSGRLESAERAPAGSGEKIRTLVVVTPASEEEALLGIPSTP